LKLTTDRHEASRGLFTTAELLVSKKPKLVHQHHLYCSMQQVARPVEVMEHI